ncbi:MAG: DUF2505 domain-containing protein [Myxococcales bacterium]|nr:DUF2505 domain-containing protein [Myxococcales bacterium]
MKLYVENELPADPATVWEVFDSPEYRERLAARADIQQEILEERTEGNVVIRRIRTEPNRELPAMAAKVLGAKKLSYIQENRYDPDASRLDWTVTLEAMPDRVQVSGSTTCTALDDGTCHRVVDGDIEVRVRLVGRQIEKAVVAEFEKSMRRAVEVAQEILDERGLA